MEIGLRMSKAGPHRCVDLLRVESSGSSAPVARFLESEEKGHLCWYRLHEPLEGRVQLAFEARSDEGVVGSHEGSRYPVPIPDPMTRSRAPLVSMIPASHERTPLTSSSLTRAS